MNIRRYLVQLSVALIAAGAALQVSRSAAQTVPAANPYKIVNSAELMGSGGIDYVHADSEGRRLYVPRGEEVLVFDLDTLKQAGSIPNAKAHGVAVNANPITASAAAIRW